ncbi:MAG: hypothetical protein NTZ74_16400 [Chloroflexi bacterium]|nr:hypothetical protein [Chloroflexota bacterium]
MNKTLRIGLVIVGGIALSALLFCAGLFVGHNNFRLAGYGPTGMMGRGSENNRFGNTMMGNGYNRMGSYQSSNGANVKPLTVDQAKQAVENYLAGLNNSDLEIKEIIIFDNNAYARITEKSTGIGAMELLVDPASLSVFPEYGPNMMWNLKYGGMSGARGMMGGRSGMMSGYNKISSSSSATMTITSDQAAKIAQQYLDRQLPGYQAATVPDPFYGYYTIDILKDGKTTGMLSVNGFSGQVFQHTWHGNFVETWE